MSLEGLTPEIIQFLGSQELKWLMLVEWLKESPGIQAVLFGIATALTFWGVSRVLRFSVHLGGPDKITIKNEKETDEK